MFKGDHIEILILPTQSGQVLIELAWSKFFHLRAGHFWKVINMQ